MKRMIAAAAVASLVLVAPAKADVRLPRIFTHHMVLQQELPIAVWGWADPGEKVSAGLDDGRPVSTTADADGRWRVDLPAAKTDGKPHTLTVRGNNTVELEDVLLGEVWLASGQSNMNRGVEVKENLPGIRLFWIDGNFTPQNDDLNPEVAGWVEATPEGLASAAPLHGGRFRGNPRKSFTEVGYVFGRKLHEELKVPVGLIQSTMGGSTAAAWTPQPNVAELYPFGKEVEGSYRGHRPGLMYQAMLHGMVPLTIRGVIWYQGEDDGRNRDYHHDMKTWIESWRTLWNRPDMPFYFVQIAPTTYAGGAMQYVWESQVWVMDHVPHTGLAVSNDILPETAVKTDPASGFPKAGGSNPHPPNKHIVAERLANIALVETYRQADRVLYGPMYESHKVEGRKILVKFRYPGGGLATRDGRPPNWFQVAPELPEDKRHPDPYHHFRRLELVPAAAEIVGPDTIAVEVPPEVKEPKYLTFAWNCEARHNLMNKEGLPAVSFRLTLGEPVAGATRFPEIGCND